MIDCRYVLYSQLRRLNGAPVKLHTEYRDAGDGILYVEGTNVYVFNNVSIGREPDGAKPADFGYKFSWCVAGVEDSDTDLFLPHYNTQSLFLTTLKGE